MSVEAMSWALRVPIGGSAKVVLLGIANHAGADFGNARPSVETLGRYAHCDRRTVQRKLRQLERAGWIEQTGVYPLADRPDRAVSVWRCTGRHIDAPQDARGGIGVPNGAARVPPEPSLEPSIQQQHIRSATTDDETESKKRAV